MSSDLGFTAANNIPWRRGRPPSRSYIFQNANVVDPVHGEILRGKTLRVVEGRICSVDDSSSLDIDGAAVVIDCSGYYVCPGLIDCHVHISFPPGRRTLSETFMRDAREATMRMPHVCEQTLSKGFTSVRDTAGFTYALKDAIEEGFVKGPRLFIAGRGLSQTGGHGDHRARHQDDGCCAGLASGQALRVCDGVPECLKAAREEFRLGADFLKIMVSGGVASPADSNTDLQFTAEEIQAITITAKNRNTYVTAHAYTSSSIQLAVENGVTCIEHGNLLDVQTANMMARNNIFLVPTLVTYFEMASPRWDGFLPPALARKNEEVLRRGLEAVQIARNAGVTMCFGTDLLGPLVMHQTKEFSLRSQVLRPLEILQSATINAARLLRQEETLGRVEPGFIADILMLKANPLEDIGVLDRPNENLAMVMKGGVVEFSSLASTPARL